MNPARNNLAAWIAALQIVLVPARASYPDLDVRGPHRRYRLAQGLENACVDELIERPASKELRQKIKLRQIELRQTAAHANA